MNKWVQSSGANMRLFYYRTRSGLECDLLVATQPDIDRRYKGEHTLLPSGLLGPVTLKSRSEPCARKSKRNARSGMAFLSPGV